MSSILRLLLHTLLQLAQENSYLHFVILCHMKVSKWVMKVTKCLNLTQIQFSVTYTLSSSVIMRSISE